jgi:rod shape-determining protein MreC
LQGILRGTPNGQLMVEKILSDEALQPGERVLTSGGDQIFPKGLEVGVVTSVKPGKESFLDIRVKPAASLSKLEEVLVITQVQNKVPQVDTSTPVRAVDILAQRLPSVPDKPADGTPATGPATGSTKPVTAAGQPKPSESGTGPVTKPAGPNTAAQAVKSASPTATPGVATRTTSVPAESATKAPQQGGTAVHTTPANAAATPGTTRVVKATSAGATPTAVKPAVAQNSAANQNPAANKKPATVEPADKSAAPATQTKPQTPAAEDKPE